jgi:hypothetical protein
MMAAYGIEYDGPRRDRAVLDDLLTISNRSRVHAEPAQAHEPQSRGQDAHVSPPEHEPLPQAAHEPQSDGQVEQVSPAPATQAPLPQASVGWPQAATSMANPRRTQRRVMRASVVKAASRP